MTRATPTRKHLLTRTASEIGKLERYHGYCGVSGISKREYCKDVSGVGCPACLEKLAKKGKRK